MASSKSAWAGVGYFAAIMMMFVGAMDFLEGLAAVIHKNYYVVGSQYVYKFDVSAWGWIHMLLGIGVALAGFFLLNGALWARIVGIIGAVLVGLTNFMWLSYSPVWSIIIISTSVLVVWALAFHGRDLADQ
jgi:hypothetical protein